MKKISQITKNISVILKFSLRYLQAKNHKKRPSTIVLLCLTGIVISVATLILVTSVMNGFRDELIKKIVGISSHITIQSVFNGKDIDQQLVDELQSKYQNQAVISPIFQGNGMLISGNRSAGVFVKGMNFSDINKRKILVDGISGEVSGCQENEIIIGYGVAINLHKKIGDSISMLVPVLSNTIFGSVPRSISLKICGIFKFGDQYDSYMIFADMNKMLQVYNLEKPQEIEIVANSFNQAEVIAEKIKDDYGGDFIIQTWKESNYSLTQALNIQRNVIFIILTLFLIMTIFTISGNLISLVNEKSKNIAILKTLGLSSKEIGSIFFISGLLITTVGSAFGAVIGLLMSYNVNKIRLWLEGVLDANLFDQNVYMLSYLPAQVEIWNVVTIVLMTILISIFASIFPAIRASKKNPLELLSQ
jgi:lipoprotein-releasing system permease protein